MDLTDGIPATDLAAARVTMLRQYEKYEFTRGDADAGLAVHRWRLAVLSARAALGFALDTLMAKRGWPTRDEVRRVANLSRIFPSPRDRKQAIALLRGCEREDDAAVYLSACWTFIDNVIQVETLGIPGYYKGNCPDDHINARHDWLEIADRLGAETPFTVGAVQQILKSDLASGIAPRS